MFEIINNQIISVKTFPWEYTAIEYIDKVKRVNKVCWECWLHSSSFTKRNLEWWWITASKKDCDLCWEAKYTASVRHYL